MSGGRELADLVRVCHDAIIGMRLEGTVTDWNPAAERLYGVPASDALGAPIGRFVPDAKLAAFRAMVDRLFRGQDVPSTEVTRMRADGREIEVEETAFAVRDAKGIVARVVLVSRDVTELARLRHVTELFDGRAPKANLAAPPSPKMREALRCADLVAAEGHATVLLLGETGVGKTWLARRIHEASGRKGKPFFEINCAGLGPELVESELFGHERGAFTGATSRKQGLVEMAEGGTLFLDEVGELPASVQAHLLTFLDTGYFRHVAGTRHVRADVRIVAATNMDLKQAVDDGRFRRDLYYRLHVVPILVPPLRERVEEIEPLAQEILVDLGRRQGQARAAMTPSAASALRGHGWPGNIRELRNVLERALILARGEPIDVAHLPDEVARALPIPTPLDDVERRAILRVLEMTNGNRTHAAEQLGISRSTLKRKLAAMRSGTGGDFVS